jgi:ABC-type uncharacterized transport system substrate-binding protein
LLLPSAGDDSLLRAGERTVLSRRRFIAGVVLAVAPLGATASAQQYKAQPARVSRVGILSTGNARPAAIFQAFEQRLRELGYVEGQNLAIEFRNAEGKTDRLPGLAAELVRLNVDVVIVATDPATRAVKEASAKIPIVMVSVNYDPVELGYIASLARPGTNITGVLFLHRELTGKRLELFKEMLPTVKRIAVLSDPSRPSNSVQCTRQTGRGSHAPVTRAGKSFVRLRRRVPRRRALSGRGAPRLDDPRPLPRALENRAAGLEEPAPDKLCA